MGRSQYVLGLLGFQVLLLASAPGSAATTTPALQRSYVSMRGSDANNCGSKAPCRTWRAALAQTESGGEVIALDSGEFGTLNITGPVAIVVPPGVYGAIGAPAGTTGITINAPGGTVVLRGLTVQNQGGDVGIDVVAANSVIIDKCTVADFSAAAGVRANAISVGLHITDSVLRGNFVGILAENVPSVAVTDSRILETGNTGVLIRYALASGTTRAYIGNSDISGGTFGLFVFSATSGGSADAVVDNSRIAGAGHGAYASSSGATANASLVVTNSRIEGNSYGLNAAGEGATLVAERSSIVHNQVGASIWPGGTIGTLGNNTFVANGTDVQGGSLTSIAGAQK